ncbi:MAG: ATP-binding cassette domain-containing protein [Planctomycetaceae bacterium]|nr:ATP-binding cassette domain-containing protein [Planctomycetaceae bacterium]
MQLYVMRNSKVFGPLDEAGVKRMYGTGELLPQDEVSISRQGPWLPIGRMGRFNNRREATLQPMSQLPQSQAPQSQAPQSQAPQSQAPQSQAPQSHPASRPHGSPQNVAKEAIGRAQKGNPSSAVDSIMAVFAKAINETQRDVDETELIRISKRLVIGAASEAVDWLVPDPSVAPQHAEILVKNNRLYLRDLGSPIGTFINGRKQGLQPVPLGNNDVIKVGPTEFRVEGAAVRVLAGNNYAHLECQNLVKDVLNTQGGGKLRILQDVSLSIQPGSFVVILGPSGSGKSTLMNALSGRVRATAGEVLLNRENLYQNFERLKVRMANVPQKDLMHDQLSLRQMLNYTARLRLPIEKSLKAKKKRVEQVIDEIEMRPQVDSKIANYSGGQIKRASLANELLNDPGLLFIDEATSGLDEHSDREIMSMLRRVANSGKTIVCITHNLGNIPAHVDTLVVMAEGGYLAFVGSPDETLEYFDIESLDQLYLRLKEKSGQDWATAFLQTALAQRHGAIRNEALRSQKNELVIHRKAISPLQRLGIAARHGKIIFSRFGLLKLKDYRSAVVAAAQPVLVFFLIALVFGDVSEADDKFFSGSAILFLLAISAFWFGCNNSAKEIVQERELFDREKNAGLSPLGYLGAKSVILLGITLAQTVFLLTAVYFYTQLEGNFFFYEFALLAIATCGVALGLTISVFSSNTDMAVTAVPLAIIPQVILAGKIQMLEGPAQIIGMIGAPAYWCYGSLSNIWSSCFEEEVVEIYRPEAMYSEQIFLISVGVIFFFTAVLFVTCAVKLSGIHALKEVAKIN